MNADEINKNFLVLNVLDPMNKMNYFVTIIDENLRKYFSRNAMT